VRKPGCAFADLTCAKYCGAKLSYRYLQNSSMVAFQSLSETSNRTANNHLRAAKAQIVVHYRQMSGASMFVREPGNPRVGLKLKDSQHRSAT
jgi:hypothetical protein